MGPLCISSPTCTVCSGEQQQRRSNDSRRTHQQLQGARASFPPTVSTLCDALNFNQRSHRSQASHCKRFYAQSSFRTPLPQTTVLCFRLECTCAAECIIAFSVSWGRQVMSTTVLIFQPFLFQTTTVYKLATVNKRKPCFFST